MRCVASLASILSDRIVGFLLGSADPSYHSVSPDHFRGSMLD